MSTTRTALKSGGAPVGFTLAIEGYDRIITNGDPQAALDAWDGEGWNGAVTGLKIKGRIKQKWEPWATKLEGNPLTFLVQPDETDHFAKAVFKGKPSKESRLTDVFSADSSGGVLDVKNEADFSAGDQVFVGGEAMTVGSTGTGSLTMNAGQTGQFAPFTSDGNSTYPKRHDIADAQSWDVAAPPKVTDVQRNWVGKWVGLYIHRIVDGVWDTRDEAQLIYAGQIKAIQDDGIHTVVETEEVRTRIRDTVLLRDQFKGRPKAGLRLIAGDKYQYSDWSGSTRKDANDLEVVESGANGAGNAGSPEINEGYYTLAELYNTLNEWLATQASNGNTNLNATVQLVSAESGLRTGVRGTKSSSANLNLFLGANRLELMTFLGFRGDLQYHDPFWQKATQSSTGLDATETGFDSPEPPYRIWPFQQSGTSQGAVMELESTEGTWWDQTDWMPSSMRWYLDGDDRGFLMVGDDLVFAKHDSDTLFTEARTAGALKYAVSGQTVSHFPQGLRVDEEGDLEVKQIVVLVGSFKDIFARIFASIEGNGENHATYDDFPEQMGAAIPWGLLGDNFVNSIEAISERLENNAVAMRITEPTSLLKFLMPELTLRFSMLVWVADPDSGSPGLQFRAFEMPNATSADHTLDETNKAAPAGTQQDLTTKVRISHDLLRNVIKVKSDYGLDGEPRETLTVRDVVSIREYDTQRPVTINARNSFGDLRGSGEAVESKVGLLATEVLPSFAKPVRILKRSVMGDKFFMAPGDSLQISDDRVRDPDTGERGLTNRAGTLLGITYSFGGEGQEIFGEIEAMLSLEDRAFPYAPTARVDETESSGSFSAGYDSGNKRLKLKQHEHSQSGDDNDVTAFVTGDAIRIIEVDPGNPDAADSFTDTIDDKSDANDTIDLTTGFGSGGNPSFDSDKLYRVVYDDYDQAGDDQKLKAFQADDGDGKILDTIAPNVWIPQKARPDFTDVSATEAAELIAPEHYGDGRPLSSGLASALAKIANNGQNYLSAPQMPVIFKTGSEVVINPGAGSAEVLYNFPAPIGVTHVPGGMKRVVTLSVLVAGSGGGTAPTIRVRSSSQYYSGDSLIDATLTGPSRSVEFTGTTSSSWQTFDVKTLEPVPASNSPGMTWLLIEGEGDGIFGGLTDYRVGALEAA